MWFNYVYIIVDIHSFKQTHAGNMAMMAVMMMMMMIIIVIMIIIIIMMVVMATGTDYTDYSKRANRTWQISSDAKEMVWSHELDPINASILGFQPEGGWTWRIFLHIAVEGNFNGDSTATQHGVSNTSSHSTNIKRVVKAKLMFRTEPGLIVNILQGVPLPVTV